MTFNINKYQELYFTDKGMAYEDEHFIEEPSDVRDDLHELENVVTDVARDIRESQFFTSQLVNVAYIKEVIIWVEKDNEWLKKLEVVVNA